MRLAILITSIGIAGLAGAVLRWLHPATIGLGLFAGLAAVYILGLAVLVWRHDET